MVGVAKRLRPRIVVPVFVGSNPITPPRKEKVVPTGTAFFFSLRLVSDGIRTIYIPTRRWRVGRDGWTARHYNLRIPHPPKISKEGTLSLPPFYLLVSSLFLLGGRDTNLHLLSMYNKIRVCICTPGFYYSLIGTAICVM